MSDWEIKFKENQDCTTTIYCVQNGEEAVFCPFENTLTYRTPVGTTRVDSATGVGWCLGLFSGIMDSYFGNSSEVDSSDSSKVEVKKKHGGARAGSGRKAKLPTKPVRLNEDEQFLIRQLRTCNLGNHEMVKHLVKLMAVRELEELK